MLRCRKATGQRNTLRCRAAVTVGAERRDSMSYVTAGLETAYEMCKARVGLNASYCYNACAWRSGGCAFFSQSRRRWYKLLGSGLFGSLAASPLQPGFSFGTIYYHTSVKAGADVGFAREVPLGRITTNFSGNVNIDLKADVDLGIAVPSYTFAERFLGAQATVLMLVPYGRNKTSADATVARKCGFGGSRLHDSRRSHRRHSRLRRSGATIQSALECRCRQLH